MPGLIDYRLELYRRYLENPVDPDHNLWWDELDDSVKVALEELSKRQRVSEQPQPEIEPVETEQPGLVEQTLQEEPLDPKLFKQKRNRMISPGQTESWGVVQVNPDGSMDVVDDLKKVNLMMMSDIMPEGMTMDQMGEWSADIYKKGGLESEGYSLYNLSTGQIKEPKSKPIVTPTLTRNKYVSQYQSLVNRLSSGSKNWQTTRKIMANEIGMDPVERVKEIALLQAEIRGIKTSKAFDEFNRASSSDQWGEAFRILKSDPIEIGSQLFVESMAQFLPAYLHSALVTVPASTATGTAIGAATGGAPGAVVGFGYGVTAGNISAVGLASLSMEYVGMILDTMGEHGVDVTNPDQLAEAFANEELMSEARVTGLKKGVPIAILDMLSAGIAGRFFGPVKGKIGRSLIETGRQATLGGTGEALGSVVAGKEINPSAVIAESFAEIFQAGPSAMVNVSVSQNKALQQAKFNKTDVGKEILRVREEASFDEATIDMAEKLVKQNSKAFEGKSVLEFIDEVKIITDEELVERGIDPKEWKRGEGIPEDKLDKPLRGLGSTEEENGKVIIKLYQGARPQDVVEEFYGNHYLRLDEESQKSLDTYYEKYKEGGGPLTKQELFEKEGQAYYFGYMETDSTMVKVYRKIKTLLDNMFNKSTIDPKIRKMYEDAGFGRLRDADAKTGDMSFSVVPVFYNKSAEAVDKINVASLKARNVKNFFKRQGVSNEEMDAIGLPAFLRQFKPTDSIPTMQLKEHVMRNELQLEDRGTIPEAESIGAEGEFETETRYDVVEYGDTWRNMGMYREDQPPGFTSEYDADMALDEQMQFRVEEDWYELNRGEHHNYKLVEPTEDSDTWKVVGLEDQNIVYEADTEELLADKFHEGEKEILEPEYAVDEFEWMDPDAETVWRDEPQYESSTQPGGEDYQELVITLPRSEMGYTSSHWEGVENPVVHMRFNTRYDKDNNKVLFIEEIQSDWHQEGAKRGYDVATKEDMDRLSEIAGEISDKYMMTPSEAKLEIATGAYEGQDIDAVKELLSEYDAIKDKKRGVSDAPYKSFGWVTLAEKRLLRYAVDNSFDKIAWTTGKQQADRSNLRTYINSIQYRELAGEYQIKAYGKGNNPVISRNLKENELEQYVGKEVARRIIEGEGVIEKPPMGEAPKKVLSGLNLESGGEARMRLYDTEIANRFKKLVKGISRLGTVNLDTKFTPAGLGIPVEHQSIDITPAVDEKFSKPMPSFSVVPEDQIDIPEETKIQMLERYLIDELSRLKFIQKQVGEKPESQDAYMYMQNMIGRTTAKSDKIQDEIFKGKTSIIKRMTDEGYSLDNLGDYLYAKHAKERNAAKKKGKGSGMTNKEANDLLKKYKGTNMEGFADEFSSATVKRALDIRFEAGLINKVQYKNLKTYYKNYIPLKGTLENNQFTYQVGKGYSVTSSTVMTARGRETRAQNPAVQAIIDLQSAIISAEKNRAMQSFYELLKENPYSSWELSGRKHKPVYDEFGEMHLEPGQLAENEIQVFFDGKKKIIKITDEALLNAVAKTARSNSFDPLFRALQTFNTYFRAVNTTYSPGFIISNFQRDLQTALVHLGSEHPAKVYAKVVKDIPKSMKSIWNNDEDYQDFKDHGGKVGWMDFKTIDEKTEELNETIQSYSNANKFKEAMLYTGQFISEVNDVVENGVRLSTYKALVANGMSKDKAANYAKDLTVNFNKKGEWGSGMNALYVFSNAGIQGTNRIYRALTHKDLKVRTKAWGIMGGIAAFGFLSSWRNRQADEEDWEQFTEYEKDNNMMYMLPENSKGKTNSIKVRLPYGYNVPYVMGQLAEEMVNGDMQMGEAMARLIKSGVDAFMPVSGGSRAQLITPTLFDPLIQIDENKNFFGGPITKESKYGPPPKASEQHFKNVRPTTKVITSWLSEVTGGGEVKEGLIEINPARVDHIIDSYGGGLFKFVTNSITTGETFIRKGAFPDFRHIPIVRKFISEKSEYQARGVVYRMLEQSGRKKFNKEMVDRFKRQLNYAQKSGQIKSAKKRELWEQFKKNQRKVR